LVDVRQTVPTPINPLVDLGGVEADEVTNFDVGDSPFGDEASDVANAGGELLGELFDGEELGGAVGGHGGFFRLRVLSVGAWLIPATAGGHFGWPVTRCGRHL